MIKINNKVINYNKFPQGEFKIEYTPSELETYFNIKWNFESNEELVVIYMLVNHINENSLNAIINLEMDYIPYARMDRVKDKKDVFTLKWITKMINSLNLNRVYVLDPHSDVSLALINNVVDISKNRDTYIKWLYSILGIDYICYPDNGCAKRLSHLKFPNVYGSKDRDWETGEIKSLSIIGDVESGSTVLIVDDICSYGGTFYYTAKKLKELGVDKIYLYVTHCENSILKGKFENNNSISNLLECGLIEEVYTTKSICTVNHNKLNYMEDIQNVI